MAPSQRLKALILWSVAFAAVPALIAGTACLDVTPVTVSSPSFAEDGAAPADATAADVSLDASGVDAHSPDRCVACLNAPDDAGAGCGGEVAACYGNPECAAAFSCALAKGCFENGSLSQIIACGFPCAQEAGILALNDPAITLAYAIFQCSASSCGSACNISGGD